MKRDCGGDCGNTPCNCKPEDVAGYWLSRYIMAQEDVEFLGVLESMSVGPDAHWNAHCEFVAACFAGGVHPGPYADALIEQQRIFNDMMTDEDRPGI
jgi:hypothetical protein